MDRGLASDAGQDEVAEDLRQFGEFEAAVDYEAGQDEQSDQFLIEPENCDAVQAFVLVSSQFRDGAFRYEGVAAGLAMAGIKKTKIKKLFPKLRLMEAGARERLASDYRDVIGRAKQEARAEAQDTT